MKSKKQVCKEVLELWPECPPKYLEEAFYFKKSPTPQKIVRVAAFAEDVGSTFSHAEHFLMKADKIRKIEKLMIDRFGEEMADFLFELRTHTDKMVMLASLWENPKDPMHYTVSLDEDDDSHLLQAAERSEKILSEMYGESPFYIEDERTLAEFRLSKANLT